MRAILTLVTLLILLGVAAGPADAAYDQDYDYVWRVNIGEDGYLWINVLGNFTTNHNCAERWYARSKYRLDDPAYGPRTRAMLSMAVASFLSHSQVHVWTDACTEDGYPIMLQLQLAPPVPAKASGVGGSTGTGGGGTGGNDPPQRQK